MSKAPRRLPKLRLRKRITTGDFRFTAHFPVEKIGPVNIFIPDLTGPAPDTVADSERISAAIQGAMDHFRPHIHRKPCIACGKAPCGFMGVYLDRNGPPFLFVASCRECFFEERVMNFCSATWAEHQGQVGNVTPEGVAALQAVIDSWGAEVKAAGEPATASTTTATAPPSKVSPMLLDPRFNPFGAPTVGRS